MLNREERRLIVSLDDLRSYNRELCESLLAEPGEQMEAFDLALHRTALGLRDMARHQVKDDTAFYVGFKGSFGDHHVNPRTLTAEHLSQLVSIEGIVTKCSLVRPKVVRSVHYCEATTKFHFQEYKDATQMGTSNAARAAIYPQFDAQNNPLITEFGYSTYRDHQTVSIQEMPEKSPAGLLPRSVEVIFDDDLVDKVKPGDRVQIVGAYRSLGNRTASNNSSAIFRTVLIGNNVMLLSSKAGGGIAQTVINDLDIRNINKLAKKKDIFEILSQSLAPSIYGHPHIKKAILLMLLGGMEKNLDNGTHIRGYDTFFLVNF